MGVLPAHARCCMAQPMPHALEIFVQAYSITPAPPCNRAILLRQMILNRGLTHTPLSWMLAEASHSAA
jgi:hypothetical protein